MNIVGTQEDSIATLMYLALANNLFTEDETDLEDYYYSLVVEDALDSRSGGKE